jgi:dTDP-4-amino-4,6-dideoxygalactose transaminase
LKDHGKSYEAVYHREHAAGFRWLHEHIGTNWRMTEVQSAIGRVALRKLENWVETRRRNAAILAQRFSAILGLRTPQPLAHVKHAYYKFYTFIELNMLNDDWNRDRILAKVNDRGVPCFSGSCSEIYLEKAFPPEMRPRERLRIARELGETSLMFPVDPTLGPADMVRIAVAVAQVIACACGITRRSGFLAA